MTDSNTPILVLSHLRWNWVFQRPQHVMVRLARRRPVFFVEEPEKVESAAAGGWRVDRPAENVEVCTPLTVLDERGYSDGQIRTVGPMLQDLLDERGISEYIAWLYTPMALPMLEWLRPAAIAYDCMDELSAFAHAPPELLERESRLFEVADVVFTGGPSLYRAKKERHANVLCLPSSVDAAHFGKARAQRAGELPVDGAARASECGAAQIAEAEDQHHLPHPRLGYFGVIDERIDLSLLDAMARHNADWQIVMVGPVTKIDPASLPRLPNIHYMGQRPYAELPAYMRGWDVCLLPFARNRATQFISPTKTLEYMAAEKPIVSTPITDVAEPYGHIVYLGDDAASFVSACERAMSDSAEEREARTDAMREVLAKTSWDRTVGVMSEALDKAVAARSSAAGEAAFAANR